MALVIVSVGVLSVATMQTVVQRNVVEAAQRSLAAQLVHDMVRRMRANNHREALRTYVGETSPWPAAWAGREHLSKAGIPSCANDCDPAQIARLDLLDWERALDGATVQFKGQWLGGLPRPTACIEGPNDGGSGVYTLTLSWRGALALRTAAAEGCGADARQADEPLYGEADRYRRRVVLQAYIFAA